jgi:TonB family protein
MPKARPIVQPDRSVGHLALHLAALPGDRVAFGFERPVRRLPGALGFSVFWHGAVFLLILLALRSPFTSPGADGAAFAPRFNRDIVWLAEPGPSGGGGGGGNHMPDPPRLAQAPGADRVTVPVSRPESLALASALTDERPPAQVLDIPATPLAAGSTFIRGAIDVAPGNTLSQGPGSNGGAGTGRDGGIGPGRGPGLGPGWDGGFGGEAFQSGSGVTLPIKLREVVPRYTTDAMRLKIQGVAVLEAIVLPSGDVGPVRVLRSLDAVYGLDQEAIKAAKQWRFLPGRRGGQAVPVFIRIEMYFHLQ